MKPLPTTTYAVLGLLSFGPKSRYEIAQLAEASIAYFWTIAKSQVYSELARLEELGWVEGEEVEQEKLPDKRVFHMTPEGTRALDEWLSDPAYEPDRLRSSMLVKVFLASRMPRPVLLEMLTRYQQEASSHASASMDAVVKGLIESDEMRYAGFTALLGVKVSRAALEWVQEVKAILEGGKTDE